MKKIVTLLFLGVLLANNSHAQKENRLPQLTVENLKGEHIASNKIHHTDGPTIISFWATWCKPCVLELNEMQDLYQDWQDETNVKIVAISVDDTRSVSRVPAFVNGKRWDFEIYLDKNSDLKRALNINNVPYTILLDSTGKIIWKHAGYIPGDEELLYEKLLTL